MTDADVMQAASDAAAAGDTETLEALIRQHPDIVRAHIPRDPVTLLHDVAVNSVVWNYPNALAVTDLLIEAGADLNKRDAGESAATPLDWADFHSRDDIAALLKAAIGG